MRKTGRVALWAVLASGSPQDIAANAEVKAVYLGERISGAPEAGAGIAVPAVGGVPHHYEGRAA